MNPPWAFLSNKAQVFVLLKGLRQRVTKSLSDILVFPSLNITFGAKESSLISTTSFNLKLQNSCCRECTKSCHSKCLDESCCNILKDLILPSMFPHLTGLLWAEEPQLSFFAQSLLIKLASPQAAQQSIFSHGKISSVAPPWGTWLKDALLIGKGREEKKDQHPAWFEPMTSRVSLCRLVVYRSAQQLPNPDLAITQWKDT